MIPIEDAFQKASQYQESGESLDMSPQSTVEVDGVRYWPVEIKIAGNIRIIIPINAETGELAIENQDQIARTHYIANFFKDKDVGIETYLSSTLDFATETKSNFIDQKEELELFTEDSLEGDVSMGEALPSKEPLEKSLKEAIDIAEALRSTTLETQSAVDNVDTPDDTLNAFNSIHSVFDLHEEFTNKIEEIRPIAGQFNSELSSAYDNGWIDIEDYWDLGEVADEVRISQSELDRISDTIAGNKGAVNSFFDSVDDDIDIFQSRLDDRLDISQEEEERIEIVNQLSNYSKQLNDVMNESQEIPVSYLEDNDFDIISEDLSDLIVELQERCQEDANMTECLEVKNNYTQIESDLDEMRGIMDEYDPVCEPGESRECTVDGEDGIQYCIDGQWGECQPIETPGILDDMNWTLTGGLIAILLVLILYRYKDQLFEGGEETAKEKGGGMEEMWGYD